MSKKISFCSLMCVLGILSILAGNFISTATVFFYLFSTLFVYICTEEYGMKYGILTYVVITLVAFIPIPNKISMAVYGLGVGYYPVVKHIIEHLNLTQILKRICKVVFVIIAYLLCIVTLNQFVSVGISVWALFVVSLVLFLIYDYALTVGIKFYALKLRKFK